MRFDCAAIERHTVRFIVAAALLIGGCGGGSGTGSDGGGGSAAAGAGGRGGGGGGTTGAGGGAGATGAGGGAGATGAGGGAGATGAGGGAGTAGNAGAGGRGGAGGSSGRGGGGGAAGGGAAGTGGAGGGTSCTTPNGCAADQYCDFSSKRCAAIGGTCQARPQGCTSIVDPVCACDGKVYNSPCDAAAAGYDISNNGTCPPPSGMFPCGARFCMHGTQYCEQMLGGTATNPGSYACHALPAGCGTTPTCACLNGVAQCGLCAASASGDLTTTCAFP